MQNRNAPGGYQSRDAITDIWGTRTPYSAEDWLARVDEMLEAEPDTWVRSACTLCSIDCALDIGVKDGRIVGVRGRESDTTNRGRLGPKGLHGWKAVNSPDRLTQPLIRRNGRLEPATWDEAMALIVRRSKDLVERFSASSIGFYTSGQLFLEEYYTLGVIGKAGLGTPHMDGNTRLCTATSAAALKETFGADGQPGSFLDVDVADCLLHVGHNLAETGTVLWMRVLDRRRGPNPPKMIVIDPRVSATTAEADIHLAPRPGTNVAVLNGLLHLIIKSGKIDQRFIDDHTRGFEKLKETVGEYTPANVEELTGVPGDQLIAAADMIANAKALVSTVLQGVYQSFQATAAAVQVNNINLVRGMIGQPGCGILQMNGQPTAQNTREAGADGDLPGFRNWENQAHIEELAKIWNVDSAIIPHWAPPTHALQIFRYAETQSIRMLWIQATNPAVSLPDLPRIRKILANPELFVVVQDIFPNETTELADVVLPAAMWGEKTGTFTNADRTVHISHKAVEPPGNARSDLDIFRDYARRMDFRDKDGAPLIKWSTPAEAFESWKECSRGRPCDYSGLTYEALTEGGIRWPVPEGTTKGTERLYAGLVFPTAPEYAETYGHDLETGAVIPVEKYRAMEPDGRALLKPAHFLEPFEAPDAEYPFWLTTGRLVYHFHTRTRTGRAPELNEAAPDIYIEMNGHDANRHGITATDWVLVESRRGKLEAKVRITEIGRGRLFIPFHFGYWDNPERARAANELTVLDWDPVSKQPHFKYGAVRLTRIEAPSTSQPRDEKEERAPPADAAKRRHVQDYIGLLEGSERALMNALEQVAEAHKLEPDIYEECRMLAGWTSETLAEVKSLIDRYGEEQESEPERLAEAIKPKLQGSGFGLVRDLHDSWLLACEGSMSLTVLDQAAKGLRDTEMQRLIEKMAGQNERQRSWLLTRIKQAAPQALIVPS
jgi:anaerobic selenocysteine-containing dehydrogenase